MVGCCVKGCTHRSDKKKKNDLDITLHRFPIDEKRRQAWIDAIRRPGWEPDVKKRICSQHFRKEDFLTVLTRDKLKKKAVPSIFLDTVIVKEEISDEDLLEAELGDDDLLILFQRQKKIKEPKKIKKDELAALIMVSTLLF